MKQEDFVSPTMQIDTIDFIFTMYRITELFDSVELDKDEIDTEIIWLMTGLNLRAGILNGVEGSAEVLNSLVTMETIDQYQKFLDTYGEE